MMNQGPSSFHELRQYIRQDLQFTNGHPYKALFSRYFGEAGIRFSVWLRITRYFYLKGAPFFLLFLISRCILKHYSYKYSFDISFRAQIGPGLVIAHHGYIIVTSNTVIGKNCTLRPGVVFGKKLTTNSGGAVIGDDVSFGVGSVVVGNVKIGNHVVVGANSDVTKDAGSDCVVAGAPARVLHSRT